MAEYVIDTDGRRYTKEFLAAKNEWKRRCEAEGIPFRVTQGGFNGTVKASGATHHGDSIDVSVLGLTEKQVGRMIQIGREVGIACWFRTTDTAKWGTRAQGFKSYHVHGVPNLWGSPSAAAHDQAVAYRNGRDGLLRNLADLGPGHVSTYRTRTWDQYQALNKKKDWFDMFETEEDLIKFLNAWMKQFLWADKVVPGNGGVPDSSWRNNVLHIFNYCTQILLIVRQIAAKSNVDIDEAALAKQLNQMMVPVLEEAIVRTMSKSPQLNPAQLAEEIVKNYVVRLAD